jgi:hypothetical protein
VTAAGSRADSAESAQKGLHDPTPFGLRDSTLATILAHPFDKHPEAVVQGGLRAVHINKILRGLTHLVAGPRSSEIAGGEAGAFHAIVYHLSGGASAGLWPPPRDRVEAQATSRQLLRDAKRDYGETWRKRESAWQSEHARRGAAAAGALTAHRCAHARLAGLRRPARPAECAGRAQPSGGKRVAAAPSTTAPTADAPTVVAAPTTAATAKRRRAAADSPAPPLAVASPVVAPHAPDGCSCCAALRAENARLNAEIARLRALAPPHASACALPSAAAAATRRCTL